MKKLLLVALVAFSATNACADEVGDAKAAAEAWLQALDQTRYEETWNQAASILRSSISKQRWAKAASSARMPLGSLESRELIAAKVTDSVAGAPDGRYVILQYQASFENKKSAIETITPTLEDGMWRVSGYFVR